MLEQHVADSRVGDFGASKFENSASRDVRDLPIRGTRSDQQARPLPAHRFRLWYTRNPQLANTGQFKSGVAHDPPYFGVKLLPEL